jgi:ribosome-associated protein YbcJ (S4-like RNA binding protein)
MLQFQIFSEIINLQELLTCLGLIKALEAL